MEKKALLKDTKILSILGHIQRNRMNKNPKTFCNYLEYRKDTLFIEEVDCIKIAEKFGTPVYCYSVNEIKENYRRFKNALSEVNSSIFYALKANFNSNILRIFSEIGAGVDVVSKGEIELALSSGIKPNKIVFSGVGKTREEISFAIKKNILQLNVESVEELEEIEVLMKSVKKKNIEISLRVNPDVDANTHKKISTGRSEDKFGIPLHKVLGIFKKFRRNSNINITGLAVHIGSQITTIKPFEVAFQKLRKLILKLKQQGFNIYKVDLGGGIGIIYSNNKVISLEDYKNVVKTNFSDLNLKIFFEPGRSLVGSSGILISRVIRQKKGENNNFLIIDCAMNDLIRPSMYDSYHEIFPVKRNKDKEVSYDVVGPICESSDTFAKQRKIGQLKRDDLLILCSVGAYGSCMSSNYNCRIPAKEILVCGSKILE